MNNMMKCEMCGHDDKKNDGTCACGCEKNVVKKQEKIETCHVCAHDHDEPKEECDHCNA